MGQVSVLSRQGLTLQSQRLTDVCPHNELTQRGADVRNYKPIFFFVLF